MDIKLHRSVYIIGLIVIIITLFFLYLRFISTSGFIVKEYRVTNNNIGDYNGLKVVHFSDIHYKSTFDYQDFEEVIEKINYINPDIVVFTGDIFDKKLSYSSKDIKDLTTLFGKIKASYKKYSIRGDNDKEEYYNTIIGNSNFTDLSNNYDLIYSKSVNPILIAGVSSGEENVSNKLLNANRYLLSDEGEKVYSILITHEPDNAKYAGNFDLILAGHSLNGQIKLPGIGGIKKVDGARTYYDEHYKISKSDLYISGGLGTTKVNLRYFNKPSINFYRIVSK